MGYCNQARIVPLEFSQESLLLICFCPNRIHPVITIVRNSVVHVGYEFDYYPVINKRARASLVKILMTPLEFSNGILESLQLCCLWLDFNQIHGQHVRQHLLQLVLLDGYQWIKNKRARAILVKSHWKILAQLQYPIRVYGNVL